MYSKEHRRVAYAREDSSPRRAQGACAQGACAQGPNAARAAVRHALVVALGPWLLWGAIACTGEFEQVGADVLGDPSSVPDGYVLPDEASLAASAPPGGLPTAQAPVSAGMPVGDGAGGRAVGGPSSVATGAGYSELSDGRGGINLEQIAYPPELGFNMSASQAAFETSVYPLLRANCAGCHISEGKARDRGI